MEQVLWFYWLQFIVQAVLSKLLPLDSKQVLSKPLEKILKFSNQRFNYCAASCGKKAYYLLMDL